MARTKQLLIELKGDEAALRKAEEYIRALPEVRGVSDVPNGKFPRTNVERDIKEKFVLALFDME